MAKLCDSFEITLIPVSENRFIHPQTKYLHVKNSIVATDGVFERPYWEIKNSIENRDGEDLPFKDEQQISFVIKEEELELGCQTFNGLQLMSKHAHPTIQNNLKELEVGHLLNHRIDNGFLINEEMVIKDKKTKEKADTGELKGLSIGYSCKINYKPGTYKGKRYDFVLSDIQGTHLNITKKNRQRNKRANLGDSLESIFNKNEVITMEQKQRMTLLGRFAASCFGLDDEKISNDPNTVALLGDNLENDSSESEAQEATDNKNEQVANEAKTEFVTKKDLDAFGNKMLEMLQGAISGATKVKNQIDEKTALLMEIAKKIQGESYATAMLGDSEDFDSKLNKLLNICKKDDLASQSEDYKLGYLRGHADNMPAKISQSRAKLGDSLEDAKDVSTNKSQPNTSLLSSIQ